MIAPSDLPERDRGTLVLQLGDGETLHLTQDRKGFYGQTESFDFRADTAAEAVSKLNAWDADIVGWE